MGPWGTEYQNTAQSPDPVPEMVIRWPRWVRAGQLARTKMESVFAKVRLGRL